MFLFLSNLLNLINLIYYFVNRRTPKMQTYETFSEAYMGVLNEVYKNPDQDLDALFAQIDAYIQGGRLDTTPRWAANAWYVNYPVYWQNYVLADVMSSQVHHHLERDFGSLYNSKAAYDFVIRHYIAPGALIPWMDKLEAATGARLNAKALIKDMNH